MVGTLERRAEGEEGNACVLLAADSQGLSVWAPEIRVSSWPES